MRIIGGRDYYDSILGTVGRDEDIVLVRNEPKKIPASTFAVSTLFPLRYRSGIFDQKLELFIIIVAGRRFNGARTTCRTRFDIYETVNHFYDYDKLQSYMTVHMPEVIRSLDYGDCRSFFNENLTSFEIDRLIAQRVVTAVYDEGFGYDSRTRAWQVNGDFLKHYQLVKVLDPFTCFQEISSWVGGRIPRNANPMIEITDDKIKAAKHGFDKFSFRKGKQK